MSAFEIEPEIQLYAFFLNKPKFDFAFETYRHSVLIFLQSGRFEYRIDDGLERQALPGSIIYCAEGHTFHRRMILPITMHQINFCGISFREMPASIPPRVQENLIRMSEYGLCFQPAHYPRLVHYCRDTLQTLYEQTETPSDLAGMLSFIDQHFTERITNTDLCERLHCSEVTLIALFRRSVGITPQQYLCSRRLDHARQLLLTTSLPLKQIATASGFADPLYFSRVFSQKTGLSPSRFRERFRL